VPTEHSLSLETENHGAPNDTRVNSIRNSFFAWALFVVLIAYSVTVIDISNVSNFAINVVLAFLAIAWCVLSIREPIVWRLPALLIFAMAAWGVWQTLYSDQKIVYYGWITTLRWFLAGVIVFLSNQFFGDQTLGRRFRIGFIYFASAVCLLDVLQKATHTNKLLWIFESPGNGGLHGVFHYYNFFGEFIELAVPMTLWMGLGQRNPRISYLLLAALQIATVIASTSRAGSILVVLEFFVVLGLAWWRNRSGLPLPILGIALAITLVFSWVTGFDAVMTRLRQPDQFSARREINLTSIEMIKARPLTGWGLGTYPYVYPQFALYDDGSFVNRAHNDWFEWASEGGIPFAALMLIVFLWTLPLAYKSVWGLGVVFICVHAAVDYPFSRLGITGWYFVLIGMLGVWRPERRRRGRSRRPQPDSDESEDLNKHSPSDLT
jgi:O-antigen ligase